MAAAIAIGYAAFGRASSWVAATAGRSRTLKRRHNGGSSRKVAMAQAHVPYKTNPVTMKAKTLTSTTASRSARTINAVIPAATHWTKAVRQRKYNGDREQMRDRAVALLELSD